MNINDIINTNWSITDDVLTTVFTCKDGTTITVNLQFPIGTDVDGILQSEVYAELAALETTKTLVENLDKLDK